MDVERPIRVAAMQALAPWFIVEQEVPVRMRDGNAGVVDLMAVPRDIRFGAFAFAIEVKARQSIMDPGFAAWVKQASDYVGARPLRDASRPITLAFLWLVGMSPPQGNAIVEMRAMLNLAHHFRVGSIVEDDRKGIVVRMGFEDLLRSAGWFGSADPWGVQALTRIRAKRQSGGVRRAA